MKCTQIYKPEWFALLYALQRNGLW